MEPTTKTFYIIEINSADFYFERLEQAAEFFAKIAQAPVKNIQRSWEAGKTMYYVGEGTIKVSMKQETLEVYPSLKAAKFAAPEVKE